MATHSVIVQGKDLETVKRQVIEVGGIVTHELAIIHAVGARLTSDQRAALEALDPSLRIYEDAGVRTSSEGTGGEGGEEFLPYSEFPSLVRADEVHALGLEGYGVTIAVLDTGVWKHRKLTGDSGPGDRLLAFYDATRDREGPARDRSGHGSHVASIAAAGERVVEGYQGIAPAADLVVVQAFDGAGAGTYADVIRGLEWIVSDRDTYGIRVVNLSFSAPPQSYYWEDPLNQAVMAAWQAGIVVVASAGNVGPDPMTIGVPGNLPYIVTVGAMTDSFTPGDGSDDVLASFSSTGPTVEAFVKPELLAPGGHMLGMMHGSAKIKKDHPEFHFDGFRYTMSGTSQATAVVTGVVALLLEAEPWLSPDDVKCRLMASARPAVDETGALAYSIFQQGAGLVDAWEAVHSQAVSCANQGLDIELDLAGVEHYAGPARQAEDGTFYVLGLEQYNWSGDPLDPDAFIWSDAFVWSDGFCWSDGYVWSDAFVWSDGYVWSDAFVWSDGLIEPASINLWVEQE